MKPTGSSRPTFISSATWASGHVDADTSFFVAMRTPYSWVPKRGRP